MKTVVTSAYFVLLAVCSSFFLTLENATAQDAITSLPPQAGGPPPPPSLANLTAWSKGPKRQWNNRVSRAAAGTHHHPDMEAKFKEFAEKLGKTPDDLRAAVGKFLLAQGISMQHVEESLEQGHQAALHVVENIKKAMKA